MSGWHGGRWVGLWHGGANYAAPYADDGEWFRSIAEACQAMRERRDRGGWCRHWFRYVSKASDCTLTPGAHADGSGYLQLYRVTPDMTAADIREALETGYPDRMVEIGPRGGMVVTRG